MTAAIIIATSAVCCVLGVFATAWVIGRRRKATDLSRWVEQIEGADEADLAAASKCSPRAARTRPTVEIPAVSMAELVHGSTPIASSRCCERCQHAYARLYGWARPRDGWLWEEGDESQRSDVTSNVCLSETKGGAILCDDCLEDRNDPFCE